MTTVDVDVPFRLYDRAVYFPAAETLVLADVHLGRAAASSVDVPIDDGSEARERLEELLAVTEPNVVVVAGDLLHSFSRLPRGVEREVTELVDTVEEWGASPVVTPGNHDALLAEVFPGETATAYRLADGETIVCHGHERPSLDGERYVIGHDHPAISIEGRKRPCFLYGAGVSDGADVLVLPAFTRLAAGMRVNDLSASEFQSPLVTDADAFYPVVRDDSSGETLWFPPLGESRRLL